MAPADENECRQMLFTASQLDQPACVRYPRGQGPGVAIESAMRAFPFGKGQVRREGRSGLAIIAVGSMVPTCERIAEQLDATLVNLRFIKPLDEELILRIAGTHRALITGRGKRRRRRRRQRDRRMPGRQRSCDADAQSRHPDRFIEHGSREGLPDARRARPPRSRGGDDALVARREAPGRRRLMQQRPCFILATAQIGPVLHVDSAH
jgi:1-deoxy-D-xylulose-5-phosphate synthase